jgi:VIT1/CCC1 family predicted Fe2+/Mn2+ transporter
MPFLLFEDVGLDLLISAVTILTFLFAIGVWKTKLTRVKWWISGIETLAIGGLSCGLGFLFGRIVQTLVG